LTNMEKMCLNIVVAVCITAVEFFCLNKYCAEANRSYEHLKIEEIVNCFRQAESEILDVK
jgi:hypothetical protein